MYLFEIINILKLAIISNPYTENNLAPRRTKILSKVQTYMLRIFVLCALFPIITNAQSPGFDCKKVTTTVEKTICTNSDLSSLDYLLLQYYKQALDNSSNPQFIRSSQRKWLTETRNICQDVACLRNEYNKRLIFFETIVLSWTKRNRNFTGVYESNNGELLVNHLSINEITFNVDVVGPYDKDKLFSPKSHQANGSASLVGDTAYYKEGDDCSLVFVFLNDKVTISQYDCWFYTVGVGGTYKLKSKQIKGHPLN